MSIIEAPVEQLPALTERDPVSELLERAAERIERIGWVGGDQVGGGILNPHGPGCAVVSINRSRADEDVKIKAHARLADYLVSHYGALPPPKRPNGFLRDAKTVFDWNDAAGRTPQEVCRALRGAAAS